MAQEIRVVDHHQSPVFFQGEDGASVTPSDSTALQTGVLYIGSGGNVNVRTRAGTDLLFANVADGSFLPVVVDMVYSTSTTASDILILF